MTGGVRNFVAEKLPEDMKGLDDVSVIITQDSVKALQDVGAMASRLEAEIVAITGSRGKTTLKEWIFQLMEPLCEIARSPRSYNSRIGVPRSMWQIGVYHSSGSYRGRHFA